MIKSRIKSIFSDSVWSILGLVLMNAAAQFLVYPAWNNALGEESYGNVIYLMSLMNIAAVSIGSGCSYARMTQSVKKTTNNTDYLVIMLMATAFALPAAWFMGRFGGVSMSASELMLFMVLACVTMWRYYADVEYRLNLNYKGYFIYYIFISAGYIIGIILFNRTRLWPVALLPGEIFALLYVLIRGSIFKFDEKPKRERVIEVISLAAILFASNAISNFIFNADRVLLKHLISGSAVTIYYIASLLGKTMALVTTPLNSVIIGYLARFKGELTVRLMNIITAVTMAVTIIAAIACTLGSHILIPILYPDNYGTAKSLFFVTNLAQVMYFMGNIITVVLLRFSKARYQLYINVIYAAGFGAACVPMAITGGLTGFCAAILGVNSIRLLAAFLMGYADILKNGKVDKNGSNDT